MAEDEDAIPDAAEDGANADSDDDDEGGEKKKAGKGKLIAIIAVVAIAVLGGGGAGLYFMGFLDSMLGIEHALDEEDTSHEPIDLGTPAYHQLPEFVADLKTGQCRSGIIKLSLTVQVDKTEVQILIDREPKIIDRIQQFLRSRERQDLVGKDGAEALRTEIVLILNATIKPAMVQNVLFRSFVLQ